jgi:tetratricopeptide (TPR) repeat protein
MSRCKASLLASLVGLSLLVAGVPAEAQKAGPTTATTGKDKKKPNPKDPKLIEAKRLFELGEEAYSKGDYEKAIESWEKSYELSGKELILESIANACERIGQQEKARDYLGRWREAAPASEHADLDAKLARLDERIAKDKAEKAAKEKAEKEEQAKRDAEDRAKPQGGKIFMPGIIIGGAGAVVALTGGVLDIVAGTTRPDPSAVCGTASDGKQICRESARSDIETSNTLATVGDIMLIAGGVATAVGVVLVVTQSGGKKPKDEKKAAIAPWFLPGGGGIIVGGRF